MTAKRTIHMDYNEFINWATGYILLGLGEGRQLRDLVDSVIHQSLLNEVFGDNRDRSSENKT